MPVRAQVAPEDALPPRIESVRFEGDVLFSRESLALLVRTRPNRRVLGVPGLTWWLWLYEAGQSDRFGRLGRALAPLGEPPARADRALLAADAERIQLLYRQEGYRDARVSTRVDTLRPGRVRVTFHIAPGAPSFLRNVTYDLAEDSLRAMPPDEALLLAARSLLRPGDMVLAGDQPTFRADAQRYSEATLVEERRRVLTFLRDRGFAAVTRDSIRALVFPAPGDSLDVTLRVRPGQRYRFGDVQVSVAGPEPSVPPRSETLREGRLGVKVELRGERRLNANAIGRALRIVPGERFDGSDLLSTKRRLDATGVFSFSDVTPRWADTFRVAGEPHLPHRIELRTRPRHNIRLETFVLQRSGLGANEAESELGTGVGMTYENLNLFGGGEAFRLRTAGSIGGDFQRRLFTSAQAETAVSLSLPYFAWPLRGVEEALNLEAGRTLFSLSLLTARRDELFLIIRGRGSARYRLEMQHRPTLTSFVDVVDFTLSNPDTLLGFKREFLDRLLGEGIDPVQRAQILEDYTRPQANTTFRYTLRSARVNPLRRERGYLYEFSAGAGGYPEALGDRYLFTPDTLEGTVPGPGGARLVYRPHLRLTGEARRYRPLTTHTVLALKGTVGTAIATGPSGVVPFDQRFYSGGGTSVRGWGLRELGPGAATFTAGDATNVLGGDIKLEVGIEVRETLLRQYLGADWLAVAFVDAGNVWFGPRNPGFGDNTGRFRLRGFAGEVGVGSGIGVRVMWDYLVVRLDLAAKVHDPARAGHFLPDGLDRPLLHFGIGHAF